MTIQILNDFHDDGVFRDQSGAIWVCQSELVEGMAHAFDQATIAVHSHDRSTPFPANPYRAKGEQK